MQEPFFCGEGIGAGGPGPLSQPLQRPTAAEQAAQSASAQKPESPEAFGEKADGE